MIVERGQPGTLRLDRETFVTLIETGIKKTPTLPTASRERLRKVAQETPACAVGNYGPRFEDWPCPDEPLLDCMCPATQAKVPPTNYRARFANAFDSAVVALAEQHLPHAIGIAKIEVV
jgi:hypothetical protein